MAVARAFGLLAGLVAIGLSPAGAEPPARQGQIYPLPDTLMPADDISPPVQIVAKPGSVILRGTLAISRRITIDAPLHMAVRGIARDFPAGTVLTAMVKAGPPPATGAGDGPYFCTPPIRSRANAFYVVLSSVGTKLEPWARFCLIDPRSHGTFEAAFLNGATDHAEETIVPIAPVAYHEDRYVPEDPADRIEVRYEKFHATSTVMTLRIAYVKGGKEQYPQAIATFTDGKPLVQDTDLHSDPVHHPYPTHWLMLGASLGVFGVDALGEAHFQINRNFARQFVTPIATFDGVGDEGSYLHRGE